MHKAKKKRFCVEHEKDVRKNLYVTFSENVGAEFDLTCKECGHVCVSRAGLKIDKDATHSEKSFITRRAAFRFAASVKNNVSQLTD